MPRNISWRKLVRKFNRLGFGGPYAGGRHLFMRKGDIKVIIPNPHGGDISKGMVAELLRQAEVSLEDWNKA